MEKINFTDICTNLTDEKFLDEGKESYVYHVQDDVVKIFKDVENPVFQRLSDKDLIDLSELDLNCFNKIINFIYHDSKLVGYSEKYLIDDEFSLEEFYREDNLIIFLKNLLEIKKDIITLSENGFIINDINYNYCFNNDKITFFDMNSFSRIITDNEYMKNKILNDNIRTMNIFLIGFVIYGAFKKGKQNEISLTYKSVEYNNKYCKDQYFGDFFINMNTYTIEEVENYKKVR